MQSLQVSDEYALELRAVRTAVWLAFIVYYTSAVREMIYCCVCYF